MIDWLIAYFKPISAVLQPYNDITYPILKCSAQTKINTCHDNARFNNALR